MGKELGLEQEIIDALEEPTVILDPEGSCIALNSCFRGLLETGVDPSELDSIWPGMQEVRQQEGEVTCLFRRPGKKALELKGVSSLLQSGSTMIRFATPTDQQGFFHQQRLQTLGILAGAIAHDFNNVLAGILGHTTYLRAVLPKEGPHAESLQAVSDGSERASELTSQILRFSRMEEREEPSHVDIKSIVDNSYRLVKKALPTGIKLKLEIPDESISVIGVEAKLVQVIVNLVMNAKDATGTEGEIALRLESVPFEKVRSLDEIPDDPVSDTFVMLEVEDAGCGMADEVLERALEPFFSTKGATGTGLGLSTVSSIAREFGGVLNIITAPGEGTAVQLYFPLLDAAPSEKAPTEKVPEALLRPGEGLIFIVDDESSVRNVLSLSLRHLGYEVQSFARGMDVIQYFESGEPHPDLIVLDMLMPGMAGNEVFQELKHHFQYQRVLLMSGYAKEEAVSEVLNQGGLGFLQKPFTMTELSTRVQQCLPVRSPASN